MLHFSTIFEEKLTMKKSLLIFCLALFTNQMTHAQSDIITGSEIGVDLAFSASTNGGNAGIGLKYGLNLGEYFIVGPSVRYEYLWWKNYVGPSEVVSGNRHVYGGGVFAHARFFNALFLGAEFEMLRSPYDKNGFLSVLEKTWAPTLFLGGGFSMEFNETVRINAGIMYDVIDPANSPFRSSYTFKKKTADGLNAGYLPILYRIAFFFPIS
mgnify:CR=1 FL=1